MELLYTGIIGVARTLFKVQGLDLTVTGDRNIPERGGAVIAVNHTGYMDFVYAGIGPRVHKRFIRYMTKKEMFDHKVAGPILRELRHIPVDRTAGADAYAAAVQALRDGELVGVYPEATISRSFELKKFKSGAARMALEAEVPIIPVTVWGAQRIWTKGHPKNLWRPKVPLYVHVGEPITAYEPVADCTEDVRTRMQATLDELHEQHQREHGPYPEGAFWVPKRFGGGAPSLEEATRLDDEEHAERLRKKAAEGRGGVERE